VTSHPASAIWLSHRRFVVDGCACAPACWRIKYARAGLAS